MSSTEFRRYGKRGRGKWITIYAREGHTFAVIAGVRLDTTPWDKLYRALGATLATTPWDKLCRAPGRHAGKPPIVSRAGSKPDTRWDCKPHEKSQIQSSNFPEIACGPIRWDLCDWGLFGC
jgi:hypothetical protein